MPVELPRNAWYAIALSKTLGLRAKPQQAMLFGVPLLLWRSSHGVVSALTDRCPHRGVPLSMGRLVGDNVQCGYHGWTFNVDGNCVHIPGIQGDASRDARRAAAWVVRERQGIVWIWGDRSTSPSTEPPRFPEADDSRYLVVKRTFIMPGSVFDAIENALDVPHTAFVHAGLFRVDGARRPVRCLIRRGETDATCTFEGEKPPSGLAARLLGVPRGRLQHVDRFRLPSLTEVTYRLDDRVHVVLGGAWTPIDAHQSMLIAVVCVKAPLPHALIKAVLEPIATRILKQDMRWLRAQNSLRAGGSSATVSTPIDVLGGPIRRLLADAVKGERTTVAEHEVTMWIS